MHEANRPVRFAISGYAGAGHAVRVIDRGGPLSGTLEAEDWFGASAELIGDLDGNGAPEVAVGATGDDDAPESSGAVWILFLE